MSFKFRKSSQVLIRRQKRNESEDVSFLSQKIKMSTWYARGNNHHVGIWDSHVNLDPRIYCRDGAHHAPAGEPSP